MLAKALVSLILRRGGAAAARFAFMEAGLVLVMLEGASWTIAGAKEATRLFKNYYYYLESKVDDCVAYAAHVRSADSKWYTMIVTADTAPSAESSAAASKTVKVDIKLVEGAVINTELMNDAHKTVYATASKRCDAVPEPKGSTSYLGRARDAKRPLDTRCDIVYVPEIHASVCLVRKSTSSPAIHVMTGDWRSSASRILEAGPDVTKMVDDYTVGDWWIQ